jgi:hypothetical protein
MHTSIDTIQYANIDWRNDLFFWHTNMYQLLKLIIKGRIMEKYNSVNFNSQEDKEIFLKNYKNINQFFNTFLKPYYM